MAYVFPIHHRNTHTIYNQQTLHFIGKCAVAMVTDGHFKYANWVVTFSEILPKIGKNSDLGVKHCINSHKI